MPTFTAFQSIFAVVFSVIGGFDPHDSTSSPEPMPDLSQALTGDAKGLRIGVPRAFLGDGVDRSVLDAFESSLKVMTARGAEIVAQHRLFETDQHQMRIGLRPAAHRGGQHFAAFILFHFGVPFAGRGEGRLGGAVAR